MKIVFEPTQYFKYAFEFDFSYEIVDFCRLIKEKYGWKQFNFTDKKWRFNSPEIIKFLLGKYPGLEIDSQSAEDFSAYNDLIKLEKKHLEKITEIKERTESTLEVKGLKKEPFPFQKLGIEFFLNNKGKAILADTMGLGKTVQALGFIAHTKKEKTLVICPSSVKYSWEDEIKKWTNLSYCIVTSKSKKEDFIKHVTESQIIIINYDILKSYFDFLYNIRWDCIILDEFHYIKNNQAQRTKLVKNIARRVPCRILLSGTPLLSRPVELFNGLQLMDPFTWCNWYEFTQKYCAGHQNYFGWDSSGASNIKELKGKIDRYFLRRTKEEVMKELPPKNFVDVPIELDSKNRFEYDLALSSFIEYLRNIKEKNDEEIKKSLFAEKLTKLNALRMITSMGKIKEAEELIKNIVDGGEKVLVFSCYNEPLEQLQAKFADCSVLLTGKTPDAFRKAIINDFQTNDDVKIFFGGIKASGVGITLTAASNVVFLDYSWVPADHMQAVDRAHRIGTTAECINVYQLYARDTMDEKMKNLLEKKKIIFNTLFEKGEAVEEVKQSTLVNDLIKTLDKK